MMFNLRKPVWRTLQRRLFSGVTLFAHVIAAIGFPLPEASAQSSHACGQQVCGCGTIEQCQATGCGCPHSPARTPDEDDVPSCCVKKTLVPHGPTKAKPTPIRWVIGMAAQKCGGGTTHWISTDVALPGPTPTDWQPSWPYCHSVLTSHESPFFLAAVPLDPPPRHEAV